MFGPKRTAVSVLRELVDGLSTERIGFEPSLAKKNMDVTRFRAVLQETLAWHRRQNRKLMLMMVCTTCLSLAAALAVFVGYGDRLEIQSMLIGGLIVASSGIVGFVVGFVRSRERTSELKTYYRVLKIADQITAERIALILGPDLPEMAWLKKKRKKTLASPDF